MQEELGIIEGGLQTGHLADDLLVGGESLGYAERPLLIIPKVWGRCLATQDLDLFELAVDVKGTSWRRRAEPVGP